LDVRASAGVGRRIRHREATSDRVELRLRSLDRNARLQSAHDQHTGPAAQVEVSLVRVIPDRHQHVWCPERHREPRPRYADDGEGLAVENEGAADHVASRAEMVAPELIADDGDWLSGPYVRLGLCEKPPLGRRRTEYRKEAGGDERSDDTFRLISTGEIHALTAEDGERVE